jgi:hypothetical protein
MNGGSSDRGGEATIAVFRLVNLHYALPRKRASLFTCGVCRRFMQIHQDGRPLNVDRGRPSPGTTRPDSSICRLTTWV